MMKETLFRWWFYARQGYTTYFAFALIGINTLTVTYFLAIEKAPFLQVIFPTFSVYVAVLTAIGIPILVITGFIHFRKMPAFKSEMMVHYENNPYNYKLPPGYWKNVIMPYYLISSKIMMKIAQNEKVTENEGNELTKLQKEMELLNKGGYVGHKGRVLAFGSDQKE